jgi:hypothetical protein
MIYFDLLSIRLSWSYNLDHVFCGLAWVDSCYFIVLFLN